MARAIGKDFCGNLLERHGSMPLDLRSVLVAASRFGAVTLVNQSVNSERPEEPAASTAGFFVSGDYSTPEWDRGSSPVR